MKFADGSVRIEPFAATHDRVTFRCGQQSLDRYVREQATQDIRRGVSRVYVAIFPDEPNRLLGFFTLSAASVTAVDLPPDVAKRLPRHPIPAALIGRLAVDQEFAGRGLGGMLLADAIRKAALAARTVAMTVVVVDPIDEAARAFYSAFGFQSLQGPQTRMFLSLPRDAI